MALLRWAIDRLHNHPAWFPEKKWKRNSRSGEYVFMKRCMHKSERQRCRLDIECFPEYRKKKGYLL